MMHYTVTKEKGQYVIRDNYFKSFYGAFKTYDEALAYAKKLDQKYEKERRQLSNHALTMIDFM